MDEHIEREALCRCKDCIYSFRLTDQDGNKLLLCMEMAKRGLRDDDFCSYGRRE